MAELQRATYPALAKKGRTAPMRARARYDAVTFDLLSGADASGAQA